MAKLHIELDGPLIKPGTTVILKDGDPLNNLSTLAIVLAAGTDHGPEQTVTLSTLVLIDGQPFQSDVTHTIRTATLTLEYLEA